MIDSETKERIQYMAKAQNKKMSVLIKEVFEELFDQASEFKKANMCVAGHHGSVTFAFSGKSVLKFAVGPTDEDCKRQVEEEFNLERDLE